MKSPLAFAAAAAMSLALSVAPASAGEPIMRITDGYAVHYGDLDLRSSAGQDELSARINEAVRDVCRANVGRSVSGQVSCRRQLREDVVSDASREVQFAMERVDARYASNFNSTGGR